ncbi:hypothetical protein POTOM_061584 [Populus tomentosa]|uniref:Phosphoadenosine phosphosulphate reductase domain-containing protein n=1 Tax=Populus tomentosa TaxID=118781 RepID=A0A8X7XSW1_POPTO|nr:hypothetical protein POTOM_061584 [Populus tomentosa]
MSLSNCVRLTHPLEVETRRLKETYKLLDGLKYYGIDLEYMHQEFCQVPEERRFRRALKGHRTCLDHSERTDQSPGTRATTSAVQIDTSFEGLGAGIISLVKGKPVANLVIKALWHFLHTICVPVNTICLNWLRAMH